MYSSQKFSKQLIKNINKKYPMLKKNFFNAVGAALKKDKNKNKIMEIKN